MLKADNKIYIKQWLKLKPYDAQASSDIHYLKICNAVKSILMAQKPSFLSLDFVKPKDIDVLSCLVTSYFEDIISDTNIWNSFVRYHHRLYKKFLPFYDLDDYYEDEINPQDISFLIWYFVSSLNKEVYISPLNIEITAASHKIMEVFEKSWDFIPENKQLKKYYSLEVESKDFYQARNLIDTLLFKTYLFYPDTGINMEEKELKIIHETDDRTLIMAYLNDNRDQTLHQVHTRLLGLKGNEWASELLGEQHPISSSFLKMSKKISSYFFYKGQDKQNIHLEHIASGKRFELIKESFDLSNSLTEVDTILFLGIVQWENKWWFSGIFFEQGFNANLVLDEKNSLARRREVNFLDSQRNEVKEGLEKQLETFKAFNQGSSIAFMESNLLQTFIQEYIKFYNTSLNLSVKEISEAHSKAKKDGFLGEGKILPNFSEASDTGLIFFNPVSGLEIAVGVNSAFPLSNNPYHNPSKTEEDLLFLIASPEISKELVNYCLDICFSNLTYFQSLQGKIVLENLDFLMRFWKKQNYFAEPEITLIN